MTLLPKKLPVEVQKANDHKYRVKVERVLLSKAFYSLDAFVRGSGFLTGLKIVNTSDLNVY